jgi:hypothetical protein
MAVGVADRNGVMEHVRLVHIDLCHANNVSGVTIVATCTNILRPTFFAFVANRRR